MAKTPILGSQSVSADTMIRYVAGVNSSFNGEIARQFLAVGARYGVRGDIALCQSIHETNWFRFGGDVQPSQNNFAGIGATGGGNPGASFATVAEGVTAQIQHLFAYASTAAVPAGETIVDPRFPLVARGSAPAWEDLAGRWAVPGYDRTKYASLADAMAAGETYGQRILTLYQAMAAAPSAALPILALDAGHGGTDPGASGNGIVEKDSALDLTLKTASYLRSKYAVDIRLTRSSDLFVALSDRASLANGWGAAYFVSIHHNAGGGEGYESYVYPGTRTGASGRSQDAVHSAIMAYLKPLGVADRGKKEANFAVLRETSMPALLLENLFVDQSFDAGLLKDAAVRQNLAAAIGEGIAAAMSLKPVSAAAAQSYKQEAIDWLYAQGLLTDPAWKQQPEAPLPLWAEALVLQRLHSRLLS
ncbi:MULTISPECIES: N-acetylmuramoyl-L-alanine amidase [unclassified Paenibacillus]|uniref:N-acetylmuramoyl-L-alanine amidase n=1 Tax=unclassified Paenibacillus TaxID=185978 RepID=UPI0009546286|nr:MULTISPECIES: N-acetylmuramoyl-L-alanine amidase [unclassified Paenibacillus]SIQ33665.1 N-acetylmuramoyl-L-alanine amidase [Paenibacillus sp. RU4X]SIQ55336.1 N-acetylmuramoyl-L-alanine amidase [Paenibacillus sp. RU4T]